MPKVSIRNDPEYLAAEERYTEIKVRADRAERAREAALSRLQESREFGKRGKMREAAEAMVDGNLDPSAAMVSTEAAMRELEDSARRRTICNEAVTIAAQRLSEAKYAASKRICIELRDRMRATIKDMLTGIFAAHVANEALWEFYADLEAGDVAWTSGLPALQMRSLGRIDSHSRLYWWLREAIEGGMLTPEDIRGAVPAPIRERVLELLELILRTSNRDVA